MLEKHLCGRPPIPKVSDDEDPAAALRNTEISGVEDSPCRPVRWTGDHAAAWPTSALADRAQGNSCPSKRGEKMSEGVVVRAEPAGHIFGDDPSRLDCLNGFRVVQC